jgi:hypothetical protein
MRSTMQEITNMLIDLAGKQTLPREIKIYEDVIDQSKIMQNIESNIATFIKDYPNFAKSIHDKSKKQEIINEIFSIINSFEFEIKDAYKKLWESYVLNNVSDADKITNLNNLKKKIINKKMITYIENEIRTPSKVTNVIKKILFTPLFIQDEESLTEAEKIIIENVEKANQKYNDSVIHFLEKIDFKGDENLIVNQFFNCVRLIDDDNKRNTFYNSFLQLIIADLKKPTRSESSERIMLQVYLYLINNEVIKTVNKDVVLYINTKNFDWFSYQITNMPYQLYPHWNFKTRDFILDLWQKHCIQNIYLKMNIVLSLPTSAGKTVISTAAIRKFRKIWYIVPTIPLALQLAGIIISSLIEIEKRAGETRRNVTLAIKDLHYKRFMGNDDIIVATPDQMYNLITEKKITKEVDYIIIDEFHNMANNGIGQFIECILLFAAFYQIPSICLSATIPNFDEVKTMMETRFNLPVFGVSEKKRFFNIERFMIKDLELVKIDPLQHISIETLRSNEFTHIGLPPKDVYDLYKKLVDVTRINEKEQKFLKLDDVHKLECDIFTYLKTQPEEILSQVIANNPITDDQLSLYDLFLMLKKFNTSAIKPMIIFTMDSEKCMERFNKLMVMVREYESLIYSGYNGDQPIIQEYFDMCEQQCGKVRVSDDSSKKGGAKGGCGDSRPQESEKKEASSKGGGSAPEDAEEMKENIRDNIFDNEFGTKAKLKEFYKMFIDTKIEQKLIDDFNSNYGADLTAESIRKLRNIHATKEFRKYSNRNGLYLRNKYAPHSECRLIDNDIPPEQMRKIKKRINNELQREFIIQSSMKENASANYSNYNSSSDDDVIDNDDELFLNEKVDDKGDDMTLINYDHPFMRGLEFGILGYNKLMNPALQRVSQYLINKYPFITFSDESLAVGINYPIKTVMLLGGLKGEPLEAIDNALAHQAIGRAGRRGLDIKSVAIYSGVIIEDILIQKYKHILPNNIDVIDAMFKIEDFADLKTYLRSNVRPPPQVIVPVIPVPKPIVTVSSSISMGGGGAASSSKTDILSPDYEPPENWDEQFEDWEAAADADIAKAETEALKMKADNA